MKNSAPKQKKRAVHTAPSQKIEHFLRKNTPMGHGYCSDDFEHFARLFTKLLDNCTIDGLQTQVANAG